MNRAGQIYIAKAYFGNKTLNSYNAFVGTYPLIYGDDFETLTIGNVGLSGKPLEVKFASISSHQTIYYSRAKYGPYSLASVGDIITLSSDVGTTLHLRGSLTGDNTDIDYTNIQITSPGNNSQGMIYGKVHALFNGVYQYEKCGLRLFLDSTGLCYVNNGCLTSDGGLCNFAFQKMFDRCYNLETSTSASDLSTLLPYTTLALGCYQSMFMGCTKIRKAPQLPAVNLAALCYKLMFEGCAALTSAPNLQATTLADRCYQYMFRYCTSLTTAPELPATTLDEQYCYNEMFNGCTSLNYIKCLATSRDVSKDVTYLWVQDVASTGTFVKAQSMTSWPSGNSGIPSGWTIQNV